MVYNKVTTLTNKTHMAFATPKYLSLSELRRTSKNACVFLWVYYNTVFTVCQHNFTDIPVLW